MRSIKRYDGINVVPFIDVLLVLLAIVFVISNFIALGKIDVALPSSSTKEAIKEVERKIVITDAHEFYIDDVATQKRLLEQKLQPLLRKTLSRSSPTKGRCTRILSS